MSLTYQYQENLNVKSLYLCGLIEKNAWEDSLLIDIKTLNPNFSIDNDYYFICMCENSMEKIRVAIDGKVYICASSNLVCNIIPQSFTFF